jgi:hypothetical protein
MAQEQRISTYPFYWAALADLERRAGRSVEARSLYEREIGAVEKSRRACLLREKTQAAQLTPWPSPGRVRFSTASFVLCSRGFHSWRPEDGEQAEFSEQRAL